ncbi:Predicted thiol oxidoreductase [Legionella busanensis]|uniref:Predicted thiol oxidoreductase n=1 Tax=Legionella busanensis TaxID=190655 RepID=A0A378JIN4_9GAMM|nr:di-heme oxidoredictase family protein [Legionella busanensis]STX51065.1 Predicted thiol oxidoreductase [Legionella busanensis]
MSKLNCFKSIATILLFFLAFNLYAQDINLALNARAWASTEGLPAKNAVDGNPNTRWGSIIGIDPSWLAIDLGKAYALNRVVIDWEAANAEIYEVQGSNDSNNWTILARRTGGVFGNRTDTVNVSGSYRYIRIYGIKRSVGNQWGYSIWELKVYGTDTNPNPPDEDGDFVPLFSSSTPLEPSTVIEMPTALITRFADRARDRHAREDEFHAYDHYLPFYWEHRTIQVELIDEVAKGGNRIIANVKTLWPLSAPEFRAFYRGVNTVAEYFHNVSMRVTSGDRLNYQTIITTNPKEGRALRNGDRMEIEISQFLANPPRGRANYYGTAFLYIVGQGMVPWEARGVFGNPNTLREDSFPIPVDAWLGGKTTIHHQYSAEPKDLFKQMATNTSNINGQPFMLGRRVHHTDMITGAHSEPGNPNFPELANKVGVNYINRSCVGCHVNNGRGLPPAVGTPLNNYMVVVSSDNGTPHPTVGSVLQPFATTGTPEGSVRIQSWTEMNGLRRPNFQFTPVITRFSPRITPQLVGMGLLEAIPESAILEIANNKNKGNGVAGRIRIIKEYNTGISRVGRFGWKAGNSTVREQIATALRNDMGVQNSVVPTPDCGPQQANCGPSGAVLSDTYLDQLTLYIQLLGVRAQRNSENAVVKQGKAIFSQIGCAACHVPTFTTSPYHPRAELRNQVIHPYTDLLIHDMGPDLADTLPEINNVKPSEWRTAPLWNIGLTAGVSGGEAYLHDGRARTLNEAILWHGGEGAASRTAYQGLSPDLRNALIEFLKSL